MMQNIVLPILLGAMGWLFTNTIEDFSQSQVVTYSVRTADDKNMTEIHLRNISPTRENVSFRIRITCDKKNRLCFNYFSLDSTDTQRLANFKHIQPNLSNIIDRSESNSEISALLTMPPESSFSIEIAAESDTVLVFLEGETAPRTLEERFELSLDQNLQKNSNSLIYMKGGSLLSFLVANRLGIYLAILIIIFLLIIILPFRRKGNSATK
jgi:hypothetical protein